MIRQFVILIADSNPHILKFLNREFTEKGYEVISAKNSKEVSHALSANKNIDLLIIDPYISNDNEAYFREIMNLPLPIIIHTFTNYSFIDKGRDKTAYVEKKGNSIKQLLQASSNLINNQAYAQ